MEEIKVKEYAIKKPLDSKSNGFLMSFKSSPYLYSTFFIAAIVLLGEGRISSIRVGA